MMIEIAVRMRNEGVDEPTFMAAKGNAVQALVSSWGIGPEREFAPFLNSPEPRDKVYIGMTRYSGYLALSLTVFNIGVIRYLPKFIGMQDIITGIFIRPEDENFDYVNFGKGEQITEVSVIRPNGISEKELYEARATYLKRVADEDAVVGAHGFTSLWGLKNTDVLVHCVVYRNREAYDAFKGKVEEMPYVVEFNNKTTPLIISACTNIK